MSRAFCEILISDADMMFWIFLFSFKIFRKSWKSGNLDSKGNTKENEILSPKYNISLQRPATLFSISESWSEKVIFIEFSPAYFEKVENPKISVPKEILRKMRFNLWKMTFCFSDLRHFSRFQSHEILFLYFYMIFSHFRSFCFFLVDVIFKRS